MKANLSETLSNLIPEAKKSKNLKLVQYSQRIEELTTQMKDLLIDCFEEIENTKDDLIEVSSHIV